MKKLMEKVFYDFKDILRNTLIDILRIMTIVIFLGTLLFFAPINNALLTLLFSFLVVFVFYFPRKMKVIFYHDVIQFEFKSLHWYRNKEYAIAFENIENFDNIESKSMPFFMNFIGMTDVTINTFMFRLKDGRNITQKISLRKNDIETFKRVLNEKFNDFNIV